MPGEALPSVFWIGRFSGVVWEPLASHTAPARFLSPPSSPPPRAWRGDIFSISWMRKAASGGLPYPQIENPIPLQESLSKQGGLPGRSSMELTSRALFLQWIGCKLSKLATQRRLPPFPMAGQSALLQTGG